MRTPAITGLEGGFLGLCSSAESKRSYPERSFPINSSNSFSDNGTNVEGGDIISVPIFGHYSIRVRNQGKMTTFALAAQ